MTTQSPDPMKITYTTSAADMEKIHEAFDKALEKVRSKCGRDYPIYITGKELRSELPRIIDTSPIDTDLVLGAFTSASVEHVNQAIESAYQARLKWEKVGWQKRVAIMHEAAALMRNQGRRGL